MSSEGWIKLYREVFDSDIWHDVTTFRLFIYLIGKASYRDGYKHKGTILNEGQYIRSYRKLVDDLSYKEGRGYKKYSISTIKRCVQKLVEAERLNVKETEHGTLFTILNYAKYQELEDTKQKSENAENEELGTNAERTRNEDGTKSEQDQELKNLRIKELYTTTTTSTTAVEEVANFYQENFGGAGSYVQESICYWVDDVGKDLVIEAMKRALKQNKRNWGYAERILRSWMNKNIKTVKQAKAEDIEFQNQKMAKHQRYFKPQMQASGAPVPEWFKQQKQQQAPRENAASNPVNDVKEQAELEQLLKQYSSG
ncbi:hypothetical protein CAI16_03015 [Virgibacillus dokdonensis]|uniref:DnaB/C C-terminal domain-containing protein n=1 Tax=Virgibacillus dokdonensis TaxID=302167 RepID=A0A3E0WYT3_9BACI|nr:DnaD domain protein [Virgibacillus dokdonensis]RFA37057.1 hypothetical protein CAI16_03015 [Virgibacillus dokdonensis]